MTHERPTGDRESRPPDAGPEESSEHARPVRPAEGDERPAPSPTPSGEFVGRAQPIDPARRQARPADGAASAPPTRAPSDREAGGHEQREGRAPAARPAGGRPPTSRRVRAASARGAVDRVRRTEFPVVLRGYDRSAVDAYVAEVAQLVAELEATQLPESVVQRALDEVGDETSAILKRAHEAGDEITARSRSQAEGRIQRAEREAELTRKEAEDQVRSLEDDIQNVWQERQRLIEDIRTLADDVLALADDAIERLPAPSDRDAGEEDEAAATSPAERDEPVEAERPGVLGHPPGGAAAEAEAAGTASTPLELATEPAGDDRPDEDKTLEDVTGERHPEDEDTAERPPGAAG